ncbi:hypothetical protein, partial [Raoultella terrigena]|uniref:hypothetical protein n=1 Tax=Raoultella terrigena TaxID=577 RepID=UPI001C6FF3EA
EKNGNDGDHQQHAGSQLRIFLEIPADHCVSALPAIFALTQLTERKVIDTPKAIHALPLPFDELPL